jgi:AcrR family transcriptional regulator
LPVSAPRRDRRHLRHEATRREILDAAWVMARAEGLAGLSLRALAREVGMEPQSLYTYFESKHAVYDAMFAEANRELLDRMSALDGGGDDPVAGLVAGVRLYVEFCTEDPIRYLLLYQRTIPGFEPSEESMALAGDLLERARDGLAAVGVTDDEAFDLMTALTSGIVAQQTANEPGGDRWVRLVDRALAMYLREIGVALPADLRSPA